MLCTINGAWFVASPQHRGDVYPRRLADHICLGIGSIILPAGWEVNCASVKNIKGKFAVLNKGSEGH